MDNAEVWRTGQLSCLLCCKRCLGVPGSLEPLAVELSEVPKTCLHAPESFEMGAVSGTQN